MPISRQLLAQHSRPNLVLADGSEFLCNLLQRAIESGLPERETFLVVRLSASQYQVQRLDRIAAHLQRLNESDRYGEIYRPLADLPWLPKTEHVTELDGTLSDSDVSNWKRRRKGQALIVTAGGHFLALVYEPDAMRSGNASLRRLFPDWVGSHSAAPEEGMAADEPVALPGDMPFEIAGPAAGGMIAIGRPIIEEMVVLPPEEMASPPAIGKEITPLPAQAPAESEPISVPFHTDIRFATRLKPGETRPLTVQLTKEARTESLATTTANFEFKDEYTPETVVIHLDAPDFSERTNTWQRPLEVYSFADSDKAVFILTAGADEGSRQISIDLRHRDRLVGNARFVVEISTQPAVAGPVAADALTFREPPPSVTISANPPPPPDVELRVKVDGKRLTFELQSSHEEVDASYASMGGVELSSEPQAYMQERYDELNEWAKGGAAGADATDAITSRLTAIGNSLFIQLFPDKLKRIYWKLKRLREQGKLATLHIVSDEPWIPWELVKPFDEETDDSDSFLAQGWQLSRWLAGPGHVDRLAINEARLVAPNTDLSFVQRERDFFSGLSARRVQVAEPLSRVAQVRDIALKGVELLHFSTHGRVNSQSIDSSAILLEDNLELRPDDFLGEGVAGLRKRRPLIFLNTCHGARQGFSLSGLGGWASHLIKQAKAGVFVGAQWEVNDDLAADFALRFYTELQAGQTLGSAFHAAREEIRQKAPANSTWLAYTLYGDPNIQVRWGAQ